MNGKAIITYLYKEDGEYIESFKSIANFRARYYPNDKSPKRPIFDKEESGIEYHYNKTFGVILLKRRLNKERITEIIELHNSYKINARVLKNKVEKYFKMTDLFEKSSSKNRLDAIAIYSKILLDADYDMTKLAKDINVRPKLIRERLIKSNDRLKTDPEFKKTYIRIKENNWHTKEDVLSVDDIKKIFNIDIRQKTRRHDVLYFRILYIEQEVNRKIDHRLIAFDVDLSAYQVSKNAAMIATNRNKELFIKSMNAFKAKDASIMPDFVESKIRDRIERYRGRIVKDSVVEVPTKERTLTGKEISAILMNDIKHKLWHKDVRLFTKKDMDEVYKIRDSFAI
jgi:hypothetical protein